MFKSDQPTLSSENMSKINYGRKVDAEQGQSRFLSPFDCIQKPKQLLGRQNMYQVTGSLSPSTLKSLNILSNQYRNEQEWGEYDDSEEPLYQNPLFTFLGTEFNDICLIKQIDVLSDSKLNLSQERSTFIGFEQLSIPKPVLQKGLFFDQQSPFVSKQQENDLTAPRVICSLQSAQVDEKHLTTKNVTKNMGKLLFKFIWKNRQSLKKSLNVEVQDWQKFLSNVYIWKKQNNITRSFLSSKWHQTVESSKIFRMISEHFFRKHCLNSLFRSKISGKMMYITRLKQFRNAVVNPEALSSLS